MLSLCSADFDFQKGFLPVVFGYCPLCFSWLWPSSGVYIMKGWAITMQGLPLGLMFTEDGAETGVHTLHLTCSHETPPLCWFSVPINKRTVPTHSSAGNVVQLTQYFSSMCKALSLIPSTACTGHGSICL